MTMKGLLILLSVFLTGLSQAQSLNDYKYVIVDNQYEFQKEANKYRLNEMMVFEIEKRGLKAFRNTEVLPADLNKGICNALSLKIIAKSGLRVKMTLEFVNCTNEVVFTTKDGKSNIKDYQKAYRAALREAMTSLDEVNYSYSPSKRVDQKETAIKEVIVENTPIKPSPKVEETIKSDKLVEKKPLVKNTDVITDVDYISVDKKYVLKPEGDNYNVFKNNVTIGTLKKSASGSYLAITKDFTGIGYEKDGNLIIEYDENGTQLLVFKQKK